MKKLSVNTRNWLLLHGFPWIYGDRKKLAKQIDEAIQLGKDLEKIDAELCVWEDANPDLYKLLPWYEAREQVKLDKKNGAYLAPCLAELLWIVQIDYNAVIWKSNINNVLYGENPSRTDWKTPSRKATQPAKNKRYLKNRKARESQITVSE